MRRNMFSPKMVFPPMLGVAFGLGILLAVSGFFRIALFISAVALIYSGLFSR